MLLHADLKKKINVHCFTTLILASIGNWHSFDTFYYKIYEELCLKVFAPRTLALVSSVCETLPFLNHYHVPWNQTWSEAKNEYSELLFGGTVFRIQLNFDSIAIFYIMLIHDGNFHRLTLIL